MRTPNREAGFTMVELLVVIMIIGILAAIAIPVYLGQRQKGHDASAQSDLKNAGTAEEEYLADYGDYADIDKVVAAEGVNVLPGTTLVSVFIDGAKGFCLGAMQTGGSNLPSTESSLRAFSSSIVWWYDSTAGGLQSRTINANGSNGGCPATNSATGASLKPVFYPS